MIDTAGKPYLTKVFDDLLNLYRLQKYTELVEQLDNILESTSGNFQLYNLKGMVHAARGDLPEAVSSYSQAISMNNNSPEVFFNVGNLYRKYGKFEKAIQYYQKSLHIDADYTNAKVNLLALVSNVTFRVDFPGLLDQITQFMDEGLVSRPSYLEKPIISLVKFDNNFTLASHHILEAVSDSTLNDGIQYLAQVSGLLTVLTITPVSDLEVESLLTSLRKSILLHFSEVNFNTAAVLLLEKLAIQCFVNEYIFDVTTTERETLETMIKSLDEEPYDTASLTDPRFLVVACYQPLNKLKHFQNGYIGQSPSSLVQMSIVNPTIEANIRRRKFSQMQFADATTDLVRSQYEENPYPRWISIFRPTQPKSISQYLTEQNVFPQKSEVLDKLAPSVLIAGCGTGQQAIERSFIYAHTKIDAIDISGASLAYAQRKADEMNVGNVRFQQRDILDVEGMGPFDIIECVGVIHHMGDPAIGLKALSSVLRTNGLLRLGLYSEFARRHITNFRSHERAVNTNLSLDDMKALRSKVKKGGQNFYGEITSTPDFFSLSGFRDLLLHENEHTFTLPKVSELLRLCGLTFCGFEALRLDKILSHRGHEKINNQDLMKWHKYEKEHQDTFSGMYQFWCQKL